MVLKKFNITCGNYSITKPGNIKAFSLVEMLMALLVASLLLAALAPVMTKKLNENVDVSLSGNTQIIEPCAFVNDTLDTPSDRECVVPKDATIASAIIVSGGGGGGGAQESISDNNLHVKEIERVSSELEGATSIFSPNYANTSIASTSGIFYITRDMSDFEIEMVSAGGGGGLGNSNGGGAPASQADCTALGNGKTDTTGNTGTSSKAIFRYDGLNNICVTAYNQVSNPTTYATYEKINGYTDTNCTSNYTHTDCNSNQNQMPYAYSGCKRPVCTQAGAEAACAKLSETTGINFQLPSLAQIKKWDQTTPGASYPMYVNLAMCTKGSNKNNYTAFAQIAWCGTASSTIFSGMYCPDCTSGSYPAFPYGVKLLDPYDAEFKQYYTGGADSGWSYGKDFVATPESARCVTAEAPKFTGYTGAGGMGGQYIKLKLPNEMLKKAFDQTYNSANDTYEDDPADYIRMQFLIGRGGKASSSSDDKIYTGATTSMGLYKIANGNSRSIANVTMYGGGKTQTDAVWQTVSNATTSANGIPYALDPNHFNRTAYKNEYSNNLNFRKGTVYGYTNQNFYAGENIVADLKSHILGNTITSSAGTQTGTSPGASGASYWNGMYRARTASDTPETAQPGSGGIGGYCTQGSTRNDPVCIPPTSGSAGAARFTYKRSYPGIGGNGGNSGSVLHIKNLLVREGDIIKVHIGAPGSGGMANNDGHNGGNSYIEINGKRYEVVGGKGGKTGIAANPNAANESDKFAKQGSIQTITETDIITSQTKTNLNSLDNKNYEIFPNPSNNDEKLLAQGKQAALNPNNTTIYKAGGGNGGMNIKTSPLAGLRGIPCGSFSNTTIKIGAKEYKCGDRELPTSDNYNPNPLYRTLSESDLKIKVSNYINSYAPGATGGAGAGWSNDYKTGNTPKTGQGQDGMGGYVLIYFR